MVRILAHVLKEGNAIFNFRFDVLKLSSLSLSLSILLEMIVISNGIFVFNAAEVATIVVLSSLLGHTLNGFAVTSALSSDWRSFLNIVVFKRLLLEVSTAASASAY